MSQNMGESTLSADSTERGIGLRQTICKLSTTYPNLLHVIPVSNDSVLNRIFQCENTSLGLRLVTDIGVFLVHANHDLEVAKI